MEWESLINLTPHTIHVDDEEGVRHTIPPSGTVIRLTEEEERVVPLVVRKKYSIDPAIYAMLDEEHTYIVPGMMLPYVEKDRREGMQYKHYDFLAPDTGPKSVVRDAEGRIVAVKGFIAP